MTPASVSNSNLRLRSVLMPRLSTGWIGLLLLLLIAIPCIVTLPWTINSYDHVDNPPRGLERPSAEFLMGTDLQGKSMLRQCMFGGAISLIIGASAATISVLIGVTWGAMSGFIGGRLDACLMRTVDVLYGLPYILLIGLANIALKPSFEKWFIWLGLQLTGSEQSAEGWRPVAGIFTLVLTIGGLSWLTMSRVIRGQVLSLRAQPFIEAARACGVGPRRILTHHLLPNLIGPIIVYTTLTVPSVILQESFLSFLGLGVQPPLPSWGRLTSTGVAELANLIIAPANLRWWLIIWPCALLGLTLLALNFMGDALRNRMDPRRGAEAAK